MANTNIDYRCTGIPEILEAHEIGLDTVTASRLFELRATIEAVLCGQGRWGLAPQFTQELLQTQL